MTARPKIVIVGAGFGGLEAALHLGNTDANVVVLDRHNHHVFQPLLYQVATAGLSPADISVPIRSVLRHQANTEVRLATVTNVNWKDKTVQTSAGEEKYDYLILAPGARYHYFGHEEWKAKAPGLKTISDATDIRRRILLAFENAEMETDPKKREAFLTFVLVGGGPTGVEMAGAIAELAHRALLKDFRSIDPSHTRVILLEAAPRILASFPEVLAGRAGSDLKRLGVEVRVGSAVEEISDDGVKVKGVWIPSRTVLWSAGMTAMPVATWLQVKPDPQGRVMVEKNLSVLQRDGVFVIGDAAHVDDGKGMALPGVAPVAKQEGRFVAGVIAQRLSGQKGVSTFLYKDKGNLATIGRRSAIADIKGFHLSGLFAWVLWVLIHIFYLISFRNRLTVLLEWAWNYFTFQRGARLIVPPLPE